MTSWRCDSHRHDVILKNDTDFKNKRKGNLEEISMIFEGNFGQNQDKKRKFQFGKVEAL